MKNPKNLAKELTERNEGLGEGEGVLVLVPFKNCLVLFPCFHSFFLICPPLILLPTSPLLGQYTVGYTLLLIKLY